MASRSANAQVKKVVDSMVDEVVKIFKEQDACMAGDSQTIDNVQGIGNGEVRRPTRTRRQPDRLDVKPAVIPAPKKPKKEEFKCELVMDPAPPDLRGILKPQRPDPYPAPRKSSLSVSAGKAIVKKYRKVRVSRRLNCKVIPPLPGWRPDRTRMPEDDPDEEELKRLQDVAAEEQKAAEAQRKKRKRKSIGISAVPFTSDDDTVAGGGEELTGDEVLPPGSPDVFFESYIQVNSPDSVLTTDSEADERKEERRRAFSKTLFPAIEESPIDEPSTAAGQEGTVADKEDTVADKADTVAPADVKKTERRRSVRIQPVEEEKQKTVEKRERRKSKLFPVTPLKESPLAAKPAGKSVRRRSGVIRSAPAVKKDEEESTSRMPYNDDPCRSEEEKVAGQAHNMEKKTKKVMAWLSRSDTLLGPAAATAAASDDAAAATGSGEEIHDGTAQLDTEGSDVVEGVRGADSLDSQLSDKSNSKGSNPLVETTKCDQTRRKGRRSTKMSREDIVSTSSSSKSEKSKEKEGREEKKEKDKPHPFFAQFAPKSSPTVAAAATAEAPPPQPEKKPARRRSMFMPKDTVSRASPAEPTVSEESTVAAPPVPEKKAARRRSMFVPKKPSGTKKEEEKREEEEEDEDVIEIVGEVTKEKKKEEKGEKGVSTPPTDKDPSSHSSIWRPWEIDAAPYAGLVHVGREAKEKENEGKEEEREEREGEEVVKKMRRLSVRLPGLSSYAIPASLRNEEPESAEMVPVFDEERKEDLSGRVAALAARARELAAATDASTHAWPKAMRPRSVEECVGDEEVLATGNRWLRKWKKRLDAAAEEDEKAMKSPKAKRKKRRAINGNDDSEEEDSDSDYEVRDDECRLPNPLVLSGPIGCGKTAYIRALSSSVGFSILESAPDERRAGSNLRAKLAGAVANYRVSSKPSIASFFAPKTGEEKEKKKNGEEEEGKKKGRQHTLVVIEHIDVVFAEEDKLFWPALAEILATTKIPIVLICNVVPAELQRVLAQTEEAGGAESLEIVMDRGGGRKVEQYVEVSLTGTVGRSLSSTVIPAIASRARQDLRAALHDAHWAAAGGSMRQADLIDSTLRRVDPPSFCDTVAGQSFAWTDACERRAERMGDNELCRAAEWPARGRMPAEVHARLCNQIDEIDQDTARETTARAERMMEMARSGVNAGNGGRSGLLTRAEIAIDWMPVLEKIDRGEQEKRRERGRRHQHYFNVIRNLETGASIDPLDRIQGACAFFRLTHN